MDNLPILLKQAIEYYLHARGLPGTFTVHHGDTAVITMRFKDGGSMGPQLDSEPVSYKKRTSRQLKRDKNRTSEFRTGYPNTRGRYRQLDIEDPRSLNCDPDYFLNDFYSELSPDAAVFMPGTMSPADSPLLDATSPVQSTLPRACAESVTRPPPSPPSINPELEDAERIALPDMVESMSIHTTASNDGNRDQSPPREPRKRKCTVSLNTLRSRIQNKASRRQMRCAKCRAIFTPPNADMQLPFAFYDRYKANKRLEFCTMDCRELYKKSVVPPDIKPPDG